MSKDKNKETQARWEFFDNYGNLRRLGNWFKRYKTQRTTKVKHKNKQYE